MQRIHDSGNTRGIMNEMTTVDARGLACPQPVLETKRVLEQEAADTFKVLVDDSTARENICRFARNKGCDVDVKDSGQGEYEITINRAGPELPAERQEVPVACEVPEMALQVKNVVFIGNCAMGKGDDDLGVKLMRGFLRTWIDVSPKPWRMIFINSGVKLTTVDEEAVEAVSLLEEKGVEILSCGTCLSFFGLENNLKVGKVTNMFEVIDTLNAATKVISPD